MADAVEVRCSVCGGTGVVKVTDEGIATGFRQTVTAPCAVCRPEGEDAERGAKPAQAPERVDYHDEHCACRKCRPELHTAAPPAPEPGEMSREAFAKELDRLWYMGNSGDAGAALKGFVLAHDAALRARAERATEQVRGYATMLAGRDRMLEAMTRERNEAREQREAMILDERRNVQVLGRALGYPKGPDGGDDVVVGPNTIGSLCDEIADRLAAEKRRAEEAAAQCKEACRERDEAERQNEALRDISLCRLQFPDGTVPGGTEECARGWYKWAGVFETRARDSNARLATAEKRAEEAERFIATAKCYDAEHARLERRLATAEAEVARLRKITDRRYDYRWPDPDTGEVMADPWLTAEECIARYRESDTKLRDQVARLVEAGDEAGDIMRAVLQRRYTYSERQAHVEGWLAKWAAAREVK